MERRNPRRVNALAAAILVLACAGARGEEAPEAATLAFRRGVEALRALDYAAAATAFQESYAASPKAAAMCNLALTYDRWGGHVADAIESYRKCAEDDSSGRFRDHALERARQLRAEQPAQPQTPPATSEPHPDSAPLPAEPAVVTPTPPPTTIAPPPTVVAPAPAPTTRSFFKDSAACALTAIGVAGIGVGVGLLAAGELDDHAIASTADLGKRTSLYSQAGVFEPAGYIALGVGAALVVVGVVEWAAHGRHVAARPEVRF